MCYVTFTTTVFVCSKGFAGSNHLFGTIVTNCCIIWYVASVILNTMKASEQSAPVLDSILYQQQTRTSRHTAPPRSVSPVVARPSTTLHCSNTTCAYPWHLASRLACALPQTHYCTPYCTFSTISSQLKRTIAAPHKRNKKQESVNGFIQSCSFIHNSQRWKCS